jgi:hypothetical protein
MDFSREPHILLQEMKIRSYECIDEGENMSEIPIPASEPYPQPKQSSGYGTCCKIGVVVCVLLIIGMIVIAMVFMGGILSIFGGITTGGGSTYQTRSLASYSNQNIDIYPTYYYDEFTVSSADVQTTTAPDVYFVVNAADTGSDSVTVTVHVAVYEIDKTTFDSISTWSGLSSYLVQSGDFTTSHTGYFDINNYASTYVWVVWFDASSKTSVWSVDIALTLRYNWNL